MAGWSKEEITLKDGTKVAALMPIIVSASRSTDVPAFYSDWFIERLKAGYVKWFNPFNSVLIYVGFNKMRRIVLLSKILASMLAHLVLVRRDDNRKMIWMLKMYF
jgi:hypothetical protein